MAASGIEPAPFRTKGTEHRQSATTPHKCDGGDDAGDGCSDDDDDDDDDDDVDDSNRFW